MPPDPKSPVGDDELILRHIPEVLVDSSVVSANFKLRHNETYLSVSRQAITDAAGLLKLLKTTDGSRVAAARVGDLRALGLDVRPHPSRRNPGHAGIEPSSASLADELVRIQVADLFEYLDPKTYKS